jgi:hypothetical protein
MAICAYSSTAPVTDKDKEEVTEYFNNNGFERWNKVHTCVLLLEIKSLVVQQSARSRTHTCSDAP